MNQKEKKEKRAQIMYESFNVLSIHLSYSIELWFYESGKSTGLMIDLGGESTQISAFLNYSPIPHKFERLYYGGNKIIDYLFELFN